MKYESKLSSGYQKMGHDTDNLSTAQIIEANRVTFQYLWINCYATTSDKDYLGTQQPVEDQRSILKR